MSVILGLLTAIMVCAQENPEIAPRAIPVNSGSNDVARFLAGMPVPEESPLAPLMRDPAWQTHAAFFEEQFSKLNLRQLQKLHAWQQTAFVVLEDGIEISRGNTAQGRLWPIPGI